MTYTGHIENGTVVLDSHCPLPDGTPVTVTAVAERVDAASESVHVKLAREISVSVSVSGDSWNSLPGDGASNVDHYLYGAPKRAE